MAEDKFEEQNELVSFNCIWMEEAARTSRIYINLILKRWPQKIVFQCGEESCVSWCGGTMRFCLRPSGLVRHFSMAHEHSFS